MKEQPITHPASGGSWKRNPDGSLEQIEESTEAHPGKAVMRERAAAEQAAAKAAGKSVAKAGASNAPASSSAKENSNG